MGEFVKTTIERPDGTVVWECLHRREGALRTPPDLVGSLIVTTVDVETGKRERLTELDINGRNQTTDFIGFTATALDSDGTVILMNPPDSGMRIEIYSPVRATLRPGEELKCMGHIKWDEFPLELQEA